MGGLDGEEEKKARWAAEAEAKAAEKGKRKRGGKADPMAEKPTFGAAEAKVASGWGEDGAGERETKRARSGTAPSAERGGRGGGRGGAARGRGGRGGAAGAGGDRRGGGTWTPGTGANFTALG